MRSASCTRPVRFQEQLLVVVGTVESRMGGGVKPKQGRSAVCVNCSGWSVLHGAAHGVTFRDDRICRRPWRHSASCWQLPCSPKAPAPWPTRIGIVMTTGERTTRTLEQVWRITP